MLIYRKLYVIEPIIILSVSVLRYTVFISNLLLFNLIFKSVQNVLYLNYKYNLKINKTET